MDQIAATSGTRYRRCRGSEGANRCRNSPRVPSTPPPRATREAIRLNFRMPRIMRWISVRNRLRRWTNRVLREVPLYSTPDDSQRTLKVMLVDREATPSSSSSRTKFG
jgi:hypothetical protein